MAFIAPAISAIVAKLGAAGAAKVGTSLISNMASSNLSGNSNSFGSAGKATSQPSATYAANALKSPKANSRGNAAANLSNLLAQLSTNDYGGNNLLGYALNNSLTLNKKAEK